MRSFQILVALCSLWFIGCSSDSNSQSVELPIKGKYQWDFTIPNVGEQTSIHDFSNTVIHYEMSGVAYNNAYDMIPISYDTKLQKIVAEGKGGSGNYNKTGKYFVLFLKDIKPNSVVIFKKECESKEEAKTLTPPEETTTENHGWNLYKKVN